jgi:large conductance mechanosensitive channel
MFKEFKEFAMRGNIIDLAIGVIIGGAFQKIVNSLVNDVIMPLISILTGKVNYENWVIKIKDINIGAGLFLTTIINFLIIAITIFLVIKYINKLNKKLEKLKIQELNKKLGTDKIFKRKKKKKNL